MTRARAAWARLRSWWWDDKVRTLAASASIPRGMLLDTDVAQDATSTAVRHVRHKLDADRLRPLGAMRLESHEDFVTNRVQVHASVRAVGYPARRWLVAWDRAVGLLRTPVPVAFGWLVVYVLAAVWASVSVVTR